MKWIVGVDLRPNCDGPLRFAKWLSNAGSSAGAPTDAFMGVHALDPAYTEFLREDPQRDRVTEQAQNEVSSALERTATKDIVTETKVTVGASPEDALAGIAESDEATGLILGRQAKAGEDRLVRLGGVARRLLRRLPSPVTIVPPDLDPDALGDGPIIAATDVNDDARSACEFAVELGKKTGRSVLLAHVVAMPEHWGSSYFPGDSVARVTDELKASGEMRLEKWAKESGLQGHPGVVLQGGVLARLLALAEETKAPMIVVGSHRLSPLVRFFVASVGTELAAMAKIPVMVVPPNAAGS